MSYTCKGICYKVETLNKNGAHYSKGEIFCSICDRFLLVFSSRCPCCNNALRLGKVKK